MDKKFFWGAATSAHQVEGGNHNDWTEWEKANAARLAKEALNGAPGFGHKSGWPDYIFNPPAGGPNPLQTENYISGRACDHYNRFREDFDVAKSLGHNAHRFSIEWSRVEPEEGKFDEKEIEHYREVVRALRERGLEPFVALWHWTLPLWIAEKGGVMNKKFPEYFARYSQRMVQEYKNEVEFWITLNEPDANTGAAYFLGKWPPQKRNLLLFWKARFRYAQTHRITYRALKKIDSAIQVGLILDLDFFESGGGILNNFFTWLAKRVWNFYFLDRISSSLDFIGLNYYFHSRIRYGLRNENREISDMGWEIYPEGIYHLLKDLKKYNLPIYVTENGVADARDTHRTKFIKEHVEWMKKAMAEGADVRGYFYWSLLDNFEWDKGFWPRFGLVEINYKTMGRKIRPSAWEYKKIISSEAQSAEAS